MAQSLVAQGLAVALLPRAALRVVQRPDVEVAVVADAGLRHVSVVHHREAAGMPTLQALIGALSTAAAAMPR
jgi:DNA-binding transcriptional LysR family regulator